MSGKGKGGYPSEARESLLGDYSDHGDSDDERTRSDNKIKKAQRDVDGVLDIMRDNMGKVLDRSTKLDDLEDKSEMLAEGAMQFRRGTKKLTWTMWVQSMRWKFLIALLVLIVLLWIFVPMMMPDDDDGDGDKNNK